MSILNKVYTILNESEVIAHPKIEHNGELVHTHNSEGQRIHPTDEGVKKFHDWFGKSKVVDQHGRPQVMYHGTHGNFDEFSQNKELGGMTFFSHDPQMANNFAYAKDANVVPVYLKAENIHPKVVHAANEHKAGVSTKAKGYDAVRMRDSDSDTINIGVFHPNQIKSAIGNNGSFSKESNKITESTQVDASGLQSNLKTKYPELKNLNLFDRGNDLRLDTIVVKKEHRNQGVGSRVLKDLKDHADKNGKRITLTAGVADPHMGTTSQSRLDKFYKSHGFVANKGRNKDFAITATHYYDGKLNEGFIKNAVGAALIAGAALGINHNSEKPIEVAQQLQIVKKPVPMNHEEAMSHIIKTFHVKPELAHTITTAAFKHGDPNGFPTPHHLLGLMATESSFNPKEVSKLKKDAAIGITQIRPITSGIDPKELTTVDSQVKHATNILKDFHKRANGDVNMALSSYNNGFRAVYNDRPSVNKKYAPKVLKAVEQFHKPE